MDTNHQDKRESKLRATEDKSQLPLFLPEDEKKARKELARLQKNENRAAFKAAHKRTGFEDKTLWDKLNLFATLAIPLIIAFATTGLGLLQLHLADAQHQQDQQLAVDQQRETTLTTYLNDMSNLLLNNKLLTSKPGDAMRQVARGQTLTTLRILDAVRNRIVLQFLQDANLIQGKDAIINLTNTDLESDNLYGANLRMVDLSGAYLQGATLERAHLEGALLDGAHLDGANLIHANLNGADLHNAYLFGATLNGANLLNAVIIQEQLAQAKSLQGAIMPDGSKHP